MVAKLTETAFELKLTVITKQGVEVDSSTKGSDSQSELSQWRLTEMPRLADMWPDHYIGSNWRFRDESANAILRRTGS
jgi:hypothetical protein